MKIIIILLFMPMTAMGADWVLIAATQDTELEIDRQSVRPNKGAWFKYIQTPPISKGCEGAGKKTAYSKEYVEAKCNEFTLRTKQSIAYSEKEEVLERCNYSNPEANFTEYAPETFGEVLFKAICDPGSRVKSPVATYLRLGKILEKQDELDKRELGKKHDGAECRVSTECAGVLICAKGLGFRMQCMTSDAMMKQLNTGGAK